MPRSIEPSVLAPRFTGRWRTKVYGGGPGRRVRGSIQASVEHRDPHGESLARGNAEAHGRDAWVVPRRYPRRSRRGSARAYPKSPSRARAPLSLARDGSFRLVQRRVAPSFGSEFCRRPRSAERRIGRGDPSRCAVIQPRFCTQSSVFGAPGGTRSASRDRLPYPARRTRCRFAAGRSWPRRLRACRSRPSRA